MGSSVSKKEQKKTGGKPKKRRKKKKYELETAGSQVQGSGREMALVSRVRICTLCVCVFMCVSVCIVHSLSRVIMVTSSSTPKSSSS